MTCLSVLLAALVAIAASLLGGCSDKIFGVAGSGAAAVAPGADRPQPRVTSSQPATQPTASREVRERLASAALDDQRLSAVRGGFDAGSGVIVNFAFQQATFVNHEMTERVVVPTFTISPGRGTVSGAGGLPAAAAVRPNVAGGSFSAFGATGAPLIAAGAGVNTATVVANGAVQTQVNVSAPVLQALVNSGLASVVGTGGNGGGGGINSTLVNGANNQLIQQVTTVDIGVTGLSKMMQQGVPTSVLSRLSGPNAFR